ncbi:Inner membrane transport permease YadH [Myxococcaceae bacterium]|nr:Inner membrane transport permease YadH [Myxococcaceae bacterium]
MSRLLVDAATIFRREWLRYRRDRAYWVGQLVFPLAVVGFIGLGLDRVVTLPTGTNYLGHLSSGMLALLVASGAVGGGVTLIEDRHSGFLRPLLVAPISRSSLVLGKLAARCTASLVLVGALVAILGTLAPLGIESAAALTTAVVGITAFFLGLGVVLAVRLRSLESFRLVSALVTVPLYLLSGIFYPLDTLPRPMRLASLVNPSTYGVDLLRYATLGVAEIPPLYSALVLLAASLAVLAAAVSAIDRDGAEGG